MTLPVSGPISGADFNAEFGRSSSARVSFSQMYRDGDFVPASRLVVTGWNFIGGQGFEPGGGGLPDVGTGVITSIVLQNAGSLPAGTQSIFYGAVAPSIGIGADFNVTLGGSGNNGFVSSWSLTNPGYGFAVNDLIDARFLAPGPGGFTAPQWRVTSVNTPPVVSNPEYLYTNSGGFIGPPGGDFFWRVQPGSLRINWGRNWFDGTAFFNSAGFSPTSWPSQSSTFCFGPGNPGDPYDNYRYERGPFEASFGGWDYYRIKRRPVQPIGNSAPINTSVPPSGQIGFSNMRGAEDL